MPDYVVVLAASADAHVRPDQALHILDFPTPAGTVNMTFRTRQSNEGYESPVPREMWIEVRGQSGTPFKEMIATFANAAAEITPVLAFSANAYVGDIEPKLAFDATPGAIERDFFQQFVAEEVGTIMRPGRHLNVEATVGLLEALGSHPEGERLRRAIAQYALALGHWRWGHETLAPTSSSRLRR